MRMLILCAGLWAAISASSGAEELKLAVFDMKKVFHAHPETVAAEEKVQRSREGAREAFREKTNALKEILQEHQELLMSLGNASGDPADKKRAEAAALLEKARGLEREIAEFKSKQEAELKATFLEEKNRILKSIMDAVKAFNAEGKYHLILDRSAVTANGMPMVIDVVGLEDITEEIAGKLK